MSGALVHVVDITDVLRHFLATKELSGIPRLIITIIESSAARDDVEFCIFDRREERFLLIGNRRSIDVALLDQYEFPREGDNFELWIEQFAPDLEPVEARLSKRQVHYCLLSSQWDTFPDRDGYALLGRFLKQERTTVLHHDSYLSDSLPDSDGARRFASYWSTVAKSTARIIHISEHSKQFFDNRFGACFRSIVARYDFSFSYPRIAACVSRDAIDLVKGDSPYLLVFSVIDGRKSPIPLIERLVAGNFGRQYKIVLIVRFATDDKSERIQLMELVLTHHLKVFLSPDDATYLWLIRYAHAVFYPSMHEGFGLVPLDCKQFGKACYLPAAADYAYLHDNAVPYDAGMTVDLSQPPVATNDLLPFSLSSFMRTLFAAAP